MRHWRIIYKYKKMHALNVSKAHASFVGADVPKNVSINIYGLSYTQHIMIAINIYYAFIEVLCRTYFLLVDQSFLYNFEMISHYFLWS